MDDFSINPLIVKKINKLKDTDGFKNLLVNLLEFEKLQSSLGEREYTKEYDRRVSEFLSNEE